MGTKQETMEAILAQLQALGNVYAKKMFGEYGLYYEDKMIALVCDDQLFIKPTQGGREFIKDVEVGQPYPGAKFWFYISEENWEDAMWLTELVRITTLEVLPSKKKVKKDSV